MWAANVLRSHTVGNVGVMKGGGQMLGAGGAWPEICDRNDRSRHSVSDVPHRSSFRCADSHHGFV